MPDIRRKPPLPVLFEPHPSPLAPLRDVLLVLKACVQTLRLRDELKYSDDQPRWPEGHPLGGQWKPKETGEGEENGSEASTEGFGEAPDGTPIEPVGGIPEDKLNWTTQQFMSAYCQAGIREVMPGQFLNMTILDVMKLAQAGDPYANRCIKLLNQNRFRKR
jgi:hypothetical protein